MCKGRVGILAHENRNWSCNSRHVDEKKIGTLNRVCGSASLLSLFEKLFSVSAFRPLDIFLLLDIFNACTCMVLGTYWSSSRGVKVDLSAPFVYDTFWSRPIMQTKKRYNPKLYFAVWEVFISFNICWSDIRC